MSARRERQIEREGKVEIPYLEKNYLETSVQQLFYCSCKDFQFILDMIVNLGHMSTAVNLT